MWVLLSSRLRTWLLIALAVPLLRALLRRVAASADRRDAGSRTARGLHSLEAGLGRFDRRERHRQRRGR